MHLQASSTGILLFVQKCVKLHPKWGSMEGKFLESPASGHLVDHIIRLRQRLEYLERHIRTRSQEVKNEYNQALTKILDAETPLVILLKFSITVNDGVKG